MADDLPIKITLDPGPAARGAQTLTREVAKTEDGTKAATKSFKDLEKQLDGIEKSSAKAAKAASSINFKQAASGAWQAFSRVNAELGLMNNSIGRVIGRTVEWGATGAQIAGPWGAAIGAVAGGLTSLIKNITDAEAETRKLREEQEKLAKEYWEGVKAAEQKARVEKELAPALAEHARAAKEAAEREQTLRTVMTSQADVYRKATDRAMAYSDQLYKVNAALAIQLRMAGVDPTRGTPQTDDQNAAVTATRGLRDATVEADAALVSYGKTWLEFETAASRRADRIADIEQLMSEPRASDAAKKKALEEYNKLMREGTKEIDAQTKALYEFMRAEAARRNVLDTIDTRVDVTSGIKIAPITDPLVDAAMRDQRAMHSSGPNLLTDRWMTELEALRAKGAEVSASLSSGFGSIAESIAQSAANGAASWEQMIAQMAAQTLGLFMTKGFEALGNIFGFGSTGAIGAGAAAAIPGFATGGYIPAGGRGSTDSQFVTIRKSPWESLYVNTPAQDQMMRAGSGSQQPINVHVAEGGARRIETTDRQAIIRVITETFPQLRSPSGR